MVTRKDALAERKRQDHALVLESRAAKAVAPPTSWWAQPQLTWEQWREAAEQRARELNAVSNTAHVQRKQGDL